MTFLTFHEFKIHSENNHCKNKADDKPLSAPEKDKPKAVNSKEEKIPAVAELKNSPPKNSNKLAFDCQFCAQNFDSIANLQMHFRKDHEQLITVFEEQKKKLQKNSTEIQIVQPPPNQLMMTQLPQSTTILLKTTNQQPPSVQMPTNQIQRNQTLSSPTVLVLDQKVVQPPLQTSNISNWGFGKPQGPSLKFKCRTYSCEETFTNVDALENHRKKCRPFKKFKCELYGKSLQCTKYFQSEFFINQHLQKIHIPTTIHNCNICQFSGFKSSLLEHFDSGIHAKTTSSTPSYTCTLCNLVFPSTSSLTKHNSSFHDVRTSNNILLKNIILPNNITNQGSTSNTLSYQESCNFCGLKFCDLNSLASHVEKKHNFLQQRVGYNTNPEDHFEKVVDENVRENDFTKKIGKIVDDVKNVNKQLNTSNENNGGQSTMNTDYAKMSYAHKCDYCIDIFTSLGNLKTHINIFHEEEIAQYMCNYCPACEESFVKSSDLKLHCVKVHGGKKPHKCFECNKMMASRSSLKQHFQNVHLGIRKFNCQKCPRDFFKNSDLQKHMVDFHKSPKYRFEFESKSNTNTDDVISSAHHGLKNEKCDFCPEEFFQEHFKKVHIECIHTNVVHGKVMCSRTTVLNEKNRHQIRNDFFCKTCTLYYSNQESLDDHIRSFHENFARMKSKFHQCNLCDSSFDSEKNLIKHINSLHSHLIKIFKCKFCSQDMEGSMLKLALHIKNVHEGQKVYPAPVIEKAVETESGVVVTQCPYCYQTFQDEMSLISHILNNHEMESISKDVTETKSTIFSTMNNQVILFRKHNELRREKNSNFKCLFRWMHD